MKDETQILYACPTDDCVVLRVMGRGTFLNSMPLKRTIERMQGRNPKTAFVLDLEQCDTMDSTFMGVLAGVGLGQRREGKPSLTLVNVCERAQKLLQTLGLSHFLEVRPRSDSPLSTEALASFIPTEDGPVSRRQQILHMIEAHEELINLDSRNSVQFENVLKYLEDSLERAAGAEQPAVATASQRQ